MSYLDNLKSLRNKNTVADLQAQIEKKTTGGYTKDERYFVPVVDKEGNGSVTMRFLPPPEGENAPYVKFINVSFKAPNGKYFINKSPRTFGDSCPVYDWNGQAFDEFGKDGGKEVIKNRGSSFQHRFVSNVLILKAEQQPDAVGKVFLYEYGNQVFTMIEDATKPDKDDDTKQVFDPFNPFSGANFLLKLKKKGTFAKNVEDSKFLGVSELFGGDEDKILEACQRAYPLQPEISRDKFKSYDKLKTELDNVLGRATVKAEDKLIKTEKVLEETKAAPTKVSKAEVLFDDDDDQIPF